MANTDAELLTLINHSILIFLQAKVVTWILCSFLNVLLYALLKELFIFEFVYCFVNALVKSSPQPTLADTIRYDD